MPGPYVGARDPEEIQLVISDPGYNFAAVTGDDITVTLPGGGERRDWLWTRDTSVPGQITLTHLFASDGSDVPRPGRYKFTGWLLTAASKRRLPLLFKTFNPYD